VRKTVFVRYISRLSRYQLSAKSGNNNSSLFIDSLVATRRSGSPGFHQHIKGPIALKIRVIILVPDTMQKTVGVEVQGMHPTEGIARK
jgi:hypothetical protein